MSSHPNRFEISLCQPRPPLPRGDPSSTRPIKGVCARVCGLLGRGQTRGRAFREGEGCMWDSARMMLNAQKCNCIVERKNPPRDVDGTIMGPIIILSTPQGQAFLSPYSPCHPTCLSGSPCFLSLSRTHTYRIARACMHAIRTYVSRTISTVQFPLFLSMSPVRFEVVVAPTHPLLIPGYGFWPN